MEHHDATPVFMPFIVEKESIYTFNYLESPPAHHDHHIHKSHHHQENSKSNSRTSSSNESDAQSDVEYSRTNEFSSHTAKQRTQGILPQHEHQYCLKKVVNVKQYFPEEITVHVCLDHPDGPCIIIKGYHPERLINKAFVSRSFKRRYVLPPEADLSGIQAELNETTGRFTLKVLTKLELINPEIPHNIKQNVIRRYPIQMVSAFPCCRNSCCRNVDMDKHVTFAPKI